MSKGLTWLFLDILGICLVPGLSFGAETVTSSVKQSFGFDPLSVSFGTSPTNGQYGTAGLPLSPPPLVAVPGTSWMTNATSAKYHQDFPSRIVRYGFRNGRLAAVRISLTCFEGNQNMYEERRKELLKIRDELIKHNPNHRLSYGDDGFRMQFGAMCGSEPESLFVMELEITPVERKKLDEP